MNNTVFNTVFTCGQSFSVAASQFYGGSTYVCKFTVGYKVVVAVNGNTVTGKLRNQTVFYGYLIALDNNTVAARAAE